MSKFIVDGWKACALWPDGEGIGDARNITTLNCSCETNARRNAEQWNDLGFSALGNVFPIVVWWEPIIVQVKDSIK